MNRYLWRSLVYYWRTHLGVFLGALLASAILTGSLSVGDCVRGSLRRMALSRLGATSVALGPGELFFRDDLAARLAKSTRANAAPLLMLRGTVSLPGGGGEAHSVQIIGVDERFWQLGGGPDLLAGADTDAFVANAQLAARLGLKPGETAIIRVDEPAWLSHEAPLSGAADTSVAMRLRLKSVAGAAEFGRFSLQANQTPPLTVFVPLRVLQEQVQKPGRANLLLADRLDAASANTALRKVWRLADLGLEVRELPGGAAELQTDRVFLEPGLAAAALEAAPGAQGVLTYLVNDIRRGDRSTPYSMVTATDGAPMIPPLADDEIAISSWLAEDLGAKPGDELSLRYPVAENGGRISEKTGWFKVRTVWPLIREDASWMPSFPGLADVGNCRDWKPGIPLDLTRIRPKDEAYWDDYRGTPKAFISLRAGQALWKNRFGPLTAVRYPMEAAAVDKILLDHIDPVKAGLAFQPVREQALQASGGAQDFGGLFVGFSLFLVVAALLLTGMLTRFGLEARAAETGLLLALGFDPKRLRRWRLAEGALIAGAGALAGAAAGSLYARAALMGLEAVWPRAAAHGSKIGYHAEGMTLLLGAALSFAAGIASLLLAGRGLTRRPAAELLARGPELERPATARDAQRSLFLAAICGAGAGAALAFGGRSADAFFSAGMLALIAGIAASHALLVSLARTRRQAQGLVAMGIRGAARRRGRSLTTVAVLASGVFMVVAVDVFREDPLAHAHERGSGTGGFAFYAETTMPVYKEPPGGVPMRLKEADDASCLNLNRAQTPSFLGVRPELLAQRKAFTFLDGGPGWERLEQTESDGAVPAIGDEATTRWGLGKSPGETLIGTDEAGHPFRVRIVGVLASSVLQGRLMISENQFVRRFPSTAGYRVFLMDSLTEPAREILQGRGLELVPAGKRWAEFQAVESAYLTLFEALGGLGLLLGSAGLGIVVARNVLERRHELAFLRAVGFAPRAVRWLVVCEHWALIALGLAVGGLAAAVAVGPSLATPGLHGSLVGPACTLGLLALLGGLWSWLAAWAALRGPLKDALRDE